MRGMQLVRGESRRRIADHPLILTQLIFQQERIAPHKGRGLVALLFDVHDRPRIF